MKRLLLIASIAGLAAACSPTFETQAPPTVVVPPGSVVVPAR